MKKYAKPFVPESSKILKDYIDKISPPMDFPIADIACGYGRNGAFLVDKGYSCIFCDIDEDSLNYIIQAETAPKIGLVARFNFGLSARFNFGLIA